MKSKLKDAKDHAELLEFRLLEVEEVAKVVLLKCQRTNEDSSKPTDFTNHVWFVATSSKILMFFTDCHVPWKSLFHKSRNKIDDFTLKKIHLSYPKFAISEE